MNILRIVTADTDMAEKLAIIEKEIFSDPWSAASFRSEIVSPFTTSFCAYTDELCGYVFADGDPQSSDPVYIQKIAVKKEYRRQGIAAKLLCELMKKYGENRGFVLDVRVSNQAAIMFYEKMGFIRLNGERKNFYDDPRENAYTYKSESKEVI